MMKEAKEDLKRKEKNRNEPYIDDWSKPKSNMK